MSGKTMKFNENKEYLIVANQSYFPLVFRFKNKHPELNIKIINREDFIVKVSFTYKNNPIKTLLKHNIDYSKSKTYLSLISSSNYKKNETLNNIYSYIKDSIVVNDLDLYELKRKEILFLEMDEDKEIEFLSNKESLTINKINLSDLEITKNNNIDKVIVFQNKYEQFKYIFSDIRKKLLNDSSLKSKIAILIKDETDIYYLNILSKIFDIPVFYQKKESLISKSEVRKSINQIYNSKSFSLDNLNEEVKAIIDEFDLTDVNFDIAYASLLEILSSKKRTLYPSDRGILVTDKFNFDENLFYYITCFQFDVFYKNYSDNNVISDEELVKINANPSYIKTKLDKRLKTNFIKQNNIILFSRVEQHLSDSIYDSQFVEEWGLNKADIIKKYDYKEDTGTLTSTSLVLDMNEIRDNYTNCTFNVDKKIRDYNPKFKGLSKFPYKKKDTYSVTDLESYVNCHYQYYLSKVLPDKNFNLMYKIRGTLIHSVFENFMHKDFNFEKSFTDAYNSLKNELEKKGEELGKREETYIKVIKKWLEIEMKVMHLWIDNQAATILEYDDDHEISIDYTLKDEEGNEYLFKGGKIDAVMKTSINGKSYYTIIDYKTGVETFDLKSTIIGKSIQLPLYTSALLQNKKLNEDYYFGGFGIKKNYFTSPKDAFYDSIKYTYSASNLIAGTRLCGIARFDEDYMHSIDETGFTKTKKLSKTGGKFLKIKGSQYFSEIDSEDNFIDSKNKEEIYNLEDVISDSKKAAISIIKNINNMNFDILPSSLNPSKNDRDNISCSFCPYHDICYYKKGSGIQPLYQIIKNRLSNLRKKESE